MEKIIFQDYPSTETPLNAENLNQVQTNIENAINGIVESGSNENGEWIKWADGTMICGKKITGTVACNKAWGSLFETGAISLGSWSQTFKKFHTISITNHGTSNGAWIETSYGASTTTCGSIMFCRATVKEDLNWSVHIIGYGKWK